ncbi:MAG: N-acyl-D-amino-acid deacylase [Candidatus Binataceae bacterium]|jgi:N-acyl-D-aspartate/D-glutamate deacylase|nr:N-acyl-D-amino-acid deacylase [Candidatus Binataceae bacterium]
MPEFDIHIKGGTIVDGTRVPRYQGDLWIKDGKIAQLGGRAAGSEKKTIDAGGLIVAPGFVDLHTHYDAQIRWDPYCTISGWHGVTSLVLGNCGFGFAPVKPEFRDRSMLAMTRTEAIPYAAMKEGMNWDWETIPEYLDSLDRSPKGVNCIQYMPTASLMIYVMGLEAAKTRPANEKERAEMARLLHEGMDAGLCGFSIQRLGPDSVQADFDGSPMVTDTMCDEDIFNLARVLRDRDEGFMEITQATDPADNRADLAFVKKLAGVAKRPILFQAIAPTRKNAEIHRRLLRWIEECRAEGLPIFGQGASVRSGFAFTLEHWNLYDMSPAWRALTTGTFEEKMAKLQDPEMRAAVIKETDEADARLRSLQAGVGGNPRNLIVQWVENHEELEKYVGKSLMQIGMEENRHPLDVMFDLSVATNLKAEFLGPNKGFNAEFMAEIYNASQYTFPGVSDGGAHTKFFTGGAFTTDFLRWLVRDEQRITLEEAHYRMSALPAHAAGFRDRGMLREGLAADVVVYDLNGLGIEPDWVGEITHDFPGKEWRRVQRAKGYRSIIVNGEETFAEGKCTGATPGKLLRHGHA